MSTDTDTGADTGTDTGAVRARTLAPVLLLVLAAGVLGAIHEIRSGFTDLSVYRFGGRAVLDAIPLYAAGDPVTGLPFTYPPFAALLMVPLAAVPGWLAAGLWAAASVGALAAAVLLVRRTLLVPTSPWLLTLLIGMAVALEPVWRHLALGQMNLFLMLAVLLDLLRPDRRWAGVAVGIVAGIKLTPLVFVVLLVLIGRRTAAGRALLTFATTVALGFLVLPGTSTTYWTEALVDPGRVGGPAFSSNQSAYGVLIRLLDGPPPTLLWLAVAGPVALAVLLVAAAWWRRGDRVLGTCLGGVATLVASPISWSHHWVWAVPVALWLLSRSRAWAVAWTALFLAGPVWWPPHRDNREYDWGLIDHLVGNAYVLAALALTLWAGVRLLAFPADGPDAPPTSGGLGREHRDQTPHRSHDPRPPAAPAHGLR